MKTPVNPFITSGYFSPEYFCDREAESENLMHELINGNNVALISTRRMGKTGLISHVFSMEQMKNDYLTFFIDIYATKSLSEFILALSKEIVERLKPFGRKAYELFISVVKSLQAGISFDVSGVPVFNVGVNDIVSETTTLDELFRYLMHAGKPCIIAIDEFQQIAAYPEANVEALLRTHVQHCSNARFIFAGSQRHTMGNMFLSASRPFYQSVSMIYLNPIPVDNYVKFARRLFEENSKRITSEAVLEIYERFDGITWYVQKVLNMLFSNTPTGETCDVDVIPAAIDQIVNSYRYVYAEILFRLPVKQKELLIAIAKAKNATGITSAEFIQKYKLTSASSVQAAQRVLLEKDYITSENGNYKVYDLFFRLWIVENG